MFPVHINISFFFSSTRRHTCCALLTGVQTCALPIYEEHHNVRFTAEAIRTAVELSARYIGDRKLPDKAIDVIDEVGASQRLLPESKRKKTIPVKDVEAVVAKIARIPPKSLTNDDRATPMNLAPHPHKNRKTDLRT